MIFTDADLEDTKVAVHLGATLNASALLRLLARLEAAERVCNAAMEYWRLEGDEQFIEMLNNTFDDWRKAAGK